MQIVYLPSSIKGIEWMRFYYKSSFREGSAKARNQIKLFKELLQNNPYIGKSLEEFEDVRELAVSGTPFSIIYRITNTQIEILNIHDQRSESKF